MRKFFLVQLRTLVASLGRMWRARLSTIFAVASVGLVLSLPLGLYTLSINLNSITTMVDSTPEITIFVSDDAGEQSIEELETKVVDLPEVDQITVISADEALEEFKTITGIESVVKYISENPLPTVLIVRPAEIQAGPSEFEQLVDTLRKFESVEAVEADFEWIRRLYSIVGLANAVFVVVSILLVVAAILLICNTTRLSVSSRLNEILVIDQIGGTKAFIRRPFVYIAVLQSLMAVLLSATIIEGVRISLEPHITQLAELYNSPFRLVGLPWQSWLTVTLMVCAISWVASRITVHICLRRLYATNSAPSP